MPPDPLQRLAAVASGLDVVAVQLQDAAEQALDTRLVVDDEDGARRNGRLRLLDHGPAWSFASLDDRQLDDEGCAAAGLALRPDAAAVIIDDAVGDGKPQAGALAGVFRREERIEDAAERLGLHARPVVVETDANGAVVPPRTHGELAFAARGEHRLLCVDDQIEEDLLDLVRVDHRVGELLVQVQLEIDVLHAQVVVAQLQHALEQ